MTRFVFFFICFTTLISCQKEVVIEEPWKCLPCSQYYGSASGTLQGSLTGTDTSFTNIPTVIELFEGMNDSVNLNFDYSALYDSPPGTVYIQFTQAYWTDSLIVDEENITSPYMLTSSLTANNSFKYQFIQGTITLSGDAVGVFTFDAIR